MTVELGQEAITTEEIIRREHVASAGGRKVFDAPIAFPTHATEARSADPIGGALTGASLPLTLEIKTAYRVMVSEPAYFRLSKGASAAVVGDIFIPANTPTMIQTGLAWDTLNLIKATGASDGIAQALRLV